MERHHSRYTLMLLLGMVGLTTQAIADTQLTDADLNGAYNTRSVTGRVTCHDPSIFMDTVTNGTPTAPQYYIYGSHLGRGKTSADKNYQNWTSFKAGEESGSASNSLFANTDGTLVNFSQAYNTHAITRVRNYQGEEVQFGNFNAHDWQYTSYRVQGNQWAPDVIWNKKMQKWCMYMSLNGDKWCSSIVCFTSTSPEGPWIYQGPVVFSGFSGQYQHVGFGKDQDYKHTDLELAIGTQSSLPTRYKPSGNYGNYWPNCIDPCVFYDEEGHLWMSYGSWSGGIFILRLNEDNGLRDYEYTFPYEINGATITPGAASSDCTSDPYFGRKIAGGYYVSGEASYIEYINGYYYLWMSYGGLEAAGGYQMRVFRSEQPDGPYKDCAGNNAIFKSYKLDFGSNANCDYGEKIMGQYQWDPMATAELAQGHNSAIVDHEGRAMVVYHTRFNNGTEGHQVRVHQLFQNEDGWLVTSPYEFGGETVNTVTACTQQLYTAEQVAGDYQFLALPYRQDTKNKAFETPVNITLQTDGTVTGAYTGTWSLVSGTSFIDITLNGTHTGKKDVKFKGVLTEQTIDYTDIKAMCFTAVASSDGQATSSGASLQTRGLCVWGSKADAKAAIKYTIDKLKMPATNGATVNRNLELPSQGKLGTRLEWSCDHPEILTENGKIVGSGNVTLTMTIRKDGYSYSKSVSLNVDASAVPTTQTYYPESQFKNTTSGWWQNFSDYYTIAPGEEAHFLFVNHSRKTNNWDNWCVYASNAERGASNWIEYFGVRCDNWNNTTGSNAGCTSDFNWDTFTTEMDGSEVDMTVSYLDNKLSMHCEIYAKSGNVYHYTFERSGSVNVQKVYIFFVNEGSYITSEGLGIEAVMEDKITSTGQQIFDLFGHRLNKLHQGINVVGGKKVIVRE